MTAALIRTALLTTTWGDVAGGAQIAVATLGTLDITNGVFDTADGSFTTVTGAQSEALIIYNDTHANDALLLFYDTGITGMPVTPNGGNINYTVHGSGWLNL